MSDLLARSLKRSRWEDPSETLDCLGVPADRITDLKTTDNALSLWRAGSKEKLDLTAAIIAIAATRERLDPLELAWIEEDQIKMKELPTAATPGCTPVEAHKSLHVDLIRLDHQRLAAFASILSSSLAKECYIKFTKEQVRAHLTRAVSEGTLRIDDLKPKLKELLSSHDRG